MKFEVDLKESQELIATDFSEGQEQMVADLSENQKSTNVQFSENQESIPVQFGDNQTHMDSNIAISQILQGVGIERIEKTTTEGQVDTYVITLTNGKTYSFTVTNGTDGKDGANGKDGLNGADGVDGKDGANGIDGEDGKDGTSVTVISVEESTEDGGSNIVKFSDGKTLTVKNGSKGSQGEKGETGANGADGKDGTNGKDGANGANGADGVGIANIAKTTTDGKVDTYTITLTNGKTYSFTVTNGTDGKNGNDYVLTDDDKTEIAEKAKDLIDFSSVDEIKEINAALSPFVSAISNLKGTVWLLNSTLNFSESFDYKVNFTSNGKEYTQLILTQSYNGQRYYWLLRYGGTLVYSELSGWVDDKYRRVMFTDDTGDTDLLNIINANGELKLANAWLGLDVLRTIIAGNTWVLKETFTYAEFGEVNTTFDFNFISNGESYKQISIVIYDYSPNEDYSYYSATVKYKKLDDTIVTVYNNDHMNQGGWMGEYRTIVTDDVNVSLGNFATRIATDIASRLGTHKTIIDAINDIVAKIGEASGGGDTSNLATVDKIGEIYTHEGDTEIAYADDSGMAWVQTFGIYDDDGETIKNGSIYPYIPLVAGNNIEFEIDEEHQVVKVNAEGVDTSNLATVDKITYLNFASGGVSGVGANETGIAWQSDEVEIEFNDGDDFYYGSKTYEHIPIVAGENITFEVDEENQVVKINATGGSSNENVVSRFTIETDVTTTVIDIINAIQNAGGNIGDWNVIVLTGYITETYGLQMAHYGGTVYNINGVNLSNMTTVSNTSSWDSVSLGSFQVMFRPPLPYYDESYEGQVLKIVNGEPTWVTP